MYTITENQIKVSNRKMGIAFSVVFSVVFFIAVIAETILIDYFSNYNVAEKGVNAEYFLWKFVAVFLFVYCIAAVFAIREGVLLARYVYVFDKFGISRISFSKKEFLAWKDVRDYGFSFKNRYKGSYQYSFYVSNKGCPQKSSKKKDISDVFLQIPVAFQNNWETEYFEARRYGECERQLLAFCAQYTNVNPFIPYDVHRFLNPDTKGPMERLRDKLHKKDLKK